MNRTQLIGRLGRDPEGKVSGKGTLAKFSLATHEHWTDRSSSRVLEHTEWHQLVCYDRLAEIALEFLTKGSEVYVEGKQRTTQWTDKDGKEQQGTEIRVDQLKMLRRAPKMDAVALAVSSMASIENLMRDAALGLRSDVTMADLAGMINNVRVGLLGDDCVFRRT